MRSAPPPKSIIANSRRLSASCYSVNFTALVVVLMQTILNFFLKCLKLLLLEIADNTFDCTSFVTSDQHQAQQKESNFSDKYGSGQIQYLYTISVFVFVNTTVVSPHTNMARDKYDTPMYLYLYLYLSQLNTTTMMRAGRLFRQIQSETF